eukprot:CAMPEP_0198246692 /NCGR_PEP_ID=MMETSP1446-20131203/46100_1 /TAXON_ID=1461542 ORGANISM="Unidentified sp, Strain CCMP2111" /NCGR_SAMPLE_ID=MMETSP1446 /ASSEMBLY_ACC=CAM_ASM_001112 /LENGTH=99 /DNA_ID=CAMNT_0043931015 /DNA_START=508 /DNA_END=807 /DNA_ORIENTATION=+
MMNQKWLFVAICVALLAVASARVMLQDPDSDESESSGGYGGWGWNPYGVNWGQYWQPGYWAGLYSQAIPYDMYASWVNGNTPWNLPYIGLPGLPQNGSV